MRRSTLLRRSIIHHWPAHVAVMIGVATASATLTGALLVGDSMRASLHEVAVGRLGPVDFTIRGTHFYPASLTARIGQAPDFENDFEPPIPAILLTGGVTHADRHTRAERVNVVGADQPFFDAIGPFTSGGLAAPTGRNGAINRSLADELGAAVGDDVLLRLGKPSDVSTETLLGRRDDTTVTLRLTVRAIVPDDRAGSFSISPGQATPQTAFVPLDVLQRALDKPERVNTILVTARNGDVIPPEQRNAALRAALNHTTRLADVGLALRTDSLRGYVSLESEHMLIDSAVEEAAMVAARSIGAHTSGVLTHLANRIALVDPKSDPASTPSAKSTTAPVSRGIPYSTIAAIDPTSPDLAAMISLDGTGPPALSNGQIVLNDWAASDLKARIGDRVSVAYFVSGHAGRLETRTTSFTLSAVVKLDGAAADPGFIPDYPGVTDTDNLADWDAPFPIDLRAVRDKDEAYWRDHRTTPKAFITLPQGQSLWSQGNEQLGRLTSIRFTGGGRPVDDLAQALSTELRRTIDPARVGLRVDAVCAQAEAAAGGTTDFGTLFIGFSFFLIAASAMLVSLLFRLGVERRAAETGVLLAVGFAPKAVRRIMIGEALLVAAMGAAVGLAGSLAYAWLMLAGLRTWWSDAANAPFLRLHIGPASLLVGYIGAVVVSTTSIAAALRGLTRIPVRRLMAGSTADDTARHGHADRRRSAMVAAVAIAGSVILTALAALGVAGPVGAFFGGGALLLVGAMAAWRCWLTSRSPRVIHKPGRSAIVRMGIRNARRQPGRSMLTAGLLASATFLIAAAGAFRIDVGDAADRASGTGGFALYAESALPLPYDLTTRAGREALNITPQTEGLLRDAAIVPFRLLPGDAASCTNLYRPTTPRILGASAAMIRRSGFRFAALPPTFDAKASDPWTLLEQPLPDGAIPVFGDEAAVRWQLHSDIGETLTITDERGHRATLRFVGLLAGSMLQDELVVADSRFVRLFPSIGGYGFFLIATDGATASAIEQGLERDLAPYVVDVSSATERLAGYLAVQNTYLSTFQTLGGLGLILGTFGMAAAMLRNVWERRRELAMLRALGFSRRAITGCVASETFFLLAVGLVIGVASALVAVAPGIASSAGAVPWRSLATTLGAVVAVAVVACAAVLIPALRLPIVGSLRSE